MTQPSDQLLADIKGLGLDINRMEDIYPKITESLLPVSEAKVSARTFAHWKQEGLIEMDGPSRSWNRLNLFQFVWIKMIQAMRDFGIPLDQIKQVKNLMFTNHMKEIAKDPEDYLQFLTEKSSYSQQEIEVQRRVIVESVYHVNAIPEDQQIYITILGSMVVRIMLYHEHPVITIAKVDNEFKIGCYSAETAQLFPDLNTGNLREPHLQIPLKRIVEKFFDEKTSEGIVEAFGLLSKNEKKVIDAIRKNDFKELVIKMPNNKEDLIIEKIQEGDMVNEKAKEIKRILGLNEYSEVTLKLRNDKHIYFKNKVRL